tara:strand:+ start:287 stop:1009 length:723 start_codon:yes stop_codon:yes gene_type:complete
MADYIFICGCGHTGTSILTRIIGEHSKIYTPPYESNALLTYNSLEKSWKILKELESLAIDSGCSVVLEKTARHIWHVDYIRRVVPNSKFILVTRDGRDVIGSLYKRHQDIDAAITRYRDDSMQTIRQLSCPDAIVLRYEDLIADPKKEITRILDFIGYKWEDAMLDYHKKEPLNWNRVTEHKKGSGLEGEGINQLRSWQVNQPLFDGRNSWKSRIPSSEWGKLKDFFENVGNEIMKNLGY